MVRLARFIGVDPRGSPRQVDSIIMSEVLNYVDFRKTISGFSRYLKKGGRLDHLQRTQKKIHRALAFLWKRNEIEGHPEKFFDKIRF